MLYQKLNFIVYKPGSLSFIELLPPQLSKHEVYESVSKV